MSGSRSFYRATRLTITNEMNPVPTGLAHNCKTAGGLDNVMAKGEHCGMRYAICGFLGWLCVISSSVLQAQMTDLDIAHEPSGESLRLSWKPVFPNWTGTPLRLRYQAHQSSDLRSWLPVGEPLWAAQSDPPLALYLQVPEPPSPESYYRLGWEVKFEFHDKKGPEIPSYKDQFGFFLRDLENLGVDDFEQTFTVEGYLDGVTWDVTEADFWEEFDTSPEEHNAGLPADDLERRLWDFRLNDTERSLFEQNGFVVTERLARDTFVDMFYDIWSDDLPVYFSADAALQPWHQTYDTIFKEIEEVVLRAKIIEIVRGLRSQFPAVWETHGEGPLAEGLRDVDFYLTVADSLLQLDVTPEGSTRLEAPEALPAHLPEQQDKVNQWLAKIRAHEKMEKLEPFGPPKRLVDFSQFEPRTRYEGTLSMQSYFRAMMWLGFIDFRVGGGFPTASSQRQVSGAVGLTLLLEESGQMGNWESMENLVAAFVGLSDSMTPAQLLGLLRGEGLGTLEAFRSPEALDRLQEAILGGPYGLQEIPQPVEHPCPPVQTSVPDRSFTFFGQRFVPDSWVLSQVTFDRIWRDGELLLRRIPSSVDVAFAALGNRAAVEILAGRIRDPHGMPTRDGLPYQPDLAAAYQTLQAQEDAFWQSNLYQSWLGALRQLSPPTVAETYPEVMRTEAWARRTLNTQLASWTQLRHDTLLYAKQSYTPPIFCEYPAGYVEPRPAFWDALSRLAALCREQIEALTMTGTVEVIPVYDAGDGTYSLGFGREVDASNRQEVLRDHLIGFETIMNRLASLSRTELEGKSFSEEDLGFMKRLVEDVAIEPYAGVRRYSGWYPALYLGSPLAFDVGGGDHPSDVWEPVVVDVHTVGRDDCHGYEEGVLHQAVGKVNFMMTAIEHGERGCVFAGPVFSYYEMYLSGSTDRLTNSDWENRLNANEVPPPSKWTAPFLVR